MSRIARRLRIRGVALAASLAALAVSSQAHGAFLAISGETLHRHPPDPLLSFDAGRSVQLAPHMPALARHGAADAEVVLLNFASGSVATAQEDFGDLLLYDEGGLGREVRKYLSEPGAALLFETLPGATHPATATLVRFAAPAGDVMRLYLEPGYVPLPEPGAPLALAAGAAMLGALERRRRALRPSARDVSHPSR